MAFISSHVKGVELKQELTNSQPQVPEHLPNDLERIEIEYLLRILGDADLKGKEVEMFYNLVIKLQQQYTNKK